MRDKIIRPERRRFERRSGRLSALGGALAEDAWSDRRVQCWNLEAGCSEERRKRCPAYFVRRNCWDLWAAEYFPPGRRPCCHPEAACEDCDVAGAKFHGPISVYVATPDKQAREVAHAAIEPAVTYCASLYNSRDGLLTQRPDVDSKIDFKCHRRPGVLLHESYVSEVCSSMDHLDCVFYEAE